MPISIKCLGTTAMVALLSLSAPTAFAQTESATGDAQTDTSNDGVTPVQDALDAAQLGPSTTGSDQSSDATSAGDQSSDGSLEELMDAEDVPATDGTYQAPGAGATPDPAGNTPGDIQPPEGEINNLTDRTSTDGQQTGQSGEANQTGQTGQTNQMGQTDGSDQMGQSDQATGSDPAGDSQSRAMMLDLDGFAQQIYERGYRQGYLNGISDGRQQVMQHMQQQMNRQERDRLRGEERPQQRGEGGAQQGGDTSSRQSGGTSEGSGGSVIVLPPGVSPEAFVEELMRRSQ